MRGGVFVFLGLIIILLNVFISEAADYNKIVKYENVTISRIHQMKFNLDPVMERTKDLGSLSVFNKITVMYAGESNITQCGQIIAPGVYRLQNDINMSEYCIEIFSDNVVIDGAYHHLIDNGNIGGGAAILMQSDSGAHIKGYSNITIANLEIDNNDFGIWLESRTKEINNIEIENVSIVNSSHGALQITGGVDNEYHLFISEINVKNLSIMFGRQIDDSLDAIRLSNINNSNFENINVIAKEGAPFGLGLYNSVYNVSFNNIKVEGFSNYCLLFNPTYEGDLVDENHLVNVTCIKNSPDGYPLIIYDYFGAELYREGLGKNEFTDFTVIDKNGNTTFAEYEINNTNSELTNWIFSGIYECRPIIQPGNYYLMNNLIANQEGCLWTSDIGDINIEGNDKTIYFPNEINDWSVPGLAIYRDQAVISNITINDLNCAADQETSENLNKGCIFIGGNLPPDFLSEVKISNIISTEIQYPFIIWDIRDLYLENITINNMRNDFYYRDMISPLSISEIYGNLVLNNLKIKNSKNDFDNTWLALNTWYSFHYDVMTEIRNLSLENEWGIINYPYLNIRDNSICLVKDISLPLNGCYISADKFDYLLSLNLFENLATVSSDELNLLNTSTQITLFNVPSPSNYMFKDNISCEDCKKISFFNNSFTFSANGTGNYSLLTEILETNDIVYSLLSRSGSGGGTYTCTPHPDFDWGCSEWSSCVNSKQNRTCKQVDDCGSSTNRPIVERNCLENKTINITRPRKLFDIGFTIEKYSISNISDLESVTTLFSFGQEPTPIDLTFTIKNNDNEEIYNEKWNLTVISEEVLRWKYIDHNLKDLDNGNYTAILHTVYNTNVSDDFRQYFEINKKINVSNNKLLIICYIIIISIIIFFIGVALLKVKNFRKIK